MLSEIHPEITKGLHRAKALNEYLQFLPRDASAERGYATVSRLSVRLSVCLSVRTDQVP